MRVHRATNLLLVTTLLAACGGADDAEVTPAEPAEASDEGTTEEGASADTAEVAILDDDGRRFEPADISVAVGDTVTWTHEGGLPHTVTATDGEFDSGDLAGGDTFEVALEEAGAIEYICSIHPDMTGAITVS